jgi:predicted small lipoprotein YifL
LTAALPAAPPAAPPAALPIAVSTALLTALLAGGCGLKGDLYLAENDPARAERDARGRRDTFAFPPEGAPWPPPVGDAAAAPAPAEP